MQQIVYAERLIRYQGLIYFAFTLQVLEWITIN